jgi:glucan biosynthesis protein C
MDNAAAGRRYHAMDSLRGSMMLLGILFHSALAYTSVYHRQFKDPDTDFLFDVLALVLYSVYIPLFFSTAGFFAALLCERSGAQGMLRNRFLRIYVPFCIGWLVLAPLTRVTMDFAEVVAGSGSVLAGFKSLEHVQLRWTKVFHLWFLVALTFLYLLALLVRWGVMHLGRARLKKSVAVTRRILKSPWRPMVLVAITFALGASSFVSQDAATLSKAGLPALFFALGWLLYAQVDLLPIMGRHAWAYIAVGCAMLPAVVWNREAAIVAPISDGLVNDALAAGSYAVMVAFMAFGVLGVFVAHCDGPNRVMRYLSESSYWIYLMHYPLVTFIGGLLASTQSPPLVKLAATIAVATPILLLTYHFGVRFTAIGVLLNGRKHVRYRGAEAVPVA